ncbi:porin [Rhodobacteraceae bacterium RKSG542]|nr:porin [Pseudovibrio flavus]
MVLPLVFSGLMAPVGVAKAADLPEKPTLPVYAEPLNYVKICDAYGAGYFVVPGTTTCLGIGGRVRVDAQALNFGSPPSNWSERQYEGMRYRARSYLTLDAYTDSEFGLIKAYSEMIVTSDSTNVSRGPDLTLNQAYIQFNGFTFGRTQSFFDFFTGATYGSLNRNWADDKTWVAAYTAVLQNGISVSASLEDPASRVEGVYYQPDHTWSGAGGNRLPSAIVTARIDQGWGTAKFSAAFQEVRPLDSGADTTLGWALGLGAIFNMPELGDGDAIALQAQYTNGAVGYLNADDVYDAYSDGNKTKNTNAYSISAGYTHYFTPEVRTDFDTSFMNVEVPSNNYHNDFSRFAVDWDVAWTPVAGLEIGFDAAYAETFVKGEDDFSEASATVRVQRTF